MENGKEKEEQMGTTITDIVSPSPTSLGPAFLGSERCPASGPFLCLNAFSGIVRVEMTDN